MASVSPSESAPVAVEQNKAVPPGQVAPPVRQMEFPNFWSRLLLKGMFQRQFLIPEDPPRLFESLTGFVERWLLRVDISDICIDRPIFLLGLPRSGTTMLQDICCTHPGLAYITNAMHQFHRTFCGAETVRRTLRLDAKGERYLGDSVPVEGGSPNEGLKFWAEWFGWDAHDPHYTPRDPASFTDAEVAKIHETLRKVVWCFGRPWRRFFSKNPAIIPDIPRLNRIFPDGKYVHIVRDPRNCANSMRKLYQREQAQLAFIRTQRKHGIYDDREFVPYPRVPKLAEYLEQWGPDDVRTTAHVWNDSISMVNEWKGQLGSFLQVRFEDILANPRQELARIFEFCELPPIREDNHKFWDKISEVGKTHHTNKYGEFGVIGDICRAHMQDLDYA
jgi:hypothetical protein